MGLIQNFKTIFPLILLVKMESCVMTSGENLSINILVREEQMEDKKVFIVNSEELGISDFGGTLDEAIENFKKSVGDYLEVYPEKKKILKEEKSPLLVSRIFL